MTTPTSGVRGWGEIGAGLSAGGAGPEFIEVPIFNNLILIKFNERLQPATLSNGSGFLISGAALRTGLSLKRPIAVTAAYRSAGYCRQLPISR
jgi:hypothetical protein